MRRNVKSDVKSSAQALDGATGQRRGLDPKRASGFSNFRGLDKYHCFSIDKPFEFVVRGENSVVIRLICQVANLLW